MSSYTASLTSILTTEERTPTMKNFSELLRSNLNIGYQEGSFFKEMIYTYFHIDLARFTMLRKEDQYKDTLESGLVAAILDESPYIQTFLNSNCGRYVKVGGNIAYVGGFGFVSKSLNHPSFLFKC